MCKEQMQKHKQRFKFLGGKRNIRYICIVILREKQKQSINFIKKKIQFYGHVNVCFSSVQHAFAFGRFIPAFFSKVSFLSFEYKLKANFALCCDSLQGNLIP